MSNPNPKTIAEAWQIYDTRVLPDVAGEVQRKETRRAFYAGAMVLLDIMMAGVSDDPEFTEADQALGDRIQAELAQFSDDLQTGKA